MSEFNGLFADFRQVIFLSLAIGDNIPMAEALLKESAKTSESLVPGFLQVDKENIHQLSELLIDNIEGAIIIANMSTECASVVTKALLSTSEGIEKIPELASGLNDEMVESFVFAIGQKNPEIFKDNPELMQSLRQRNDDIAELVDTVSEQSQKPLKADLKPHSASRQKEVLALEYGGEREGR